MPRWGHRGSVTPNSYPQRQTPLLAVVSLHPSSGQVGLLAAVGWLVFLLIALPVGCSATGAATRDLSFVAPTRHWCIDRVGQRPMSALPQPEGCAMDRLRYEVRYSGPAIPTRFPAGSRKWATVTPPPSFLCGGSTAVAPRPWARARASATFDTPT